ncbi:MAG: ATP-binding protein [Ignavibacteriae bacterium]|jgi:hypothetical protein|nr:ATP-binding protein [Ignavibacteriota bacterium]
MIERILQKDIESRLFKGKIIIISGARQVGKTTLAEKIARDSGEEFMLLNCDEYDVKTALENSNSVKLKNIFGKTKIIIIDEAQRVENIGLTLKIISDRIKEVQVIATGSSSFEIANKINEPLTGRKFEFELFPISFYELTSQTGLLQEKRMLGQRMLYGYYPEIVMNPAGEISLLKSIAKSNLYKDILNFEGIRKPVLVEKILKALAFQTGSEVSYTELSRLTNADKNTVEKYIDIMEKAFIIFKLTSFTGNSRVEIRKGKKFYFFDNGIRNAVINNYSPLESRTDTGALWENFIISERQKYLKNSGIDASTYFWRTINKTEIDYIEEINGKLTLYEFKWKTGKHVKPPKIFSEKYNIKNVKVITSSNYEEFLGFEG